MSKRKTTIQSALNKYKVKAIKLLVESMVGDKNYTPQQISSATNILLILQGESQE